MIVSELIAILQALPQDATVVAGEWVSPSQLGDPIADLRSDYTSQTPRVHVYAPRAEGWDEDDTGESPQGPPETSTSEVPMVAD